MADDGHILSGSLGCHGCARSFELLAGVPVLLPKEVPLVATRTAARFAAEWTRWAQLRSYYERQFFDWVAPVSRDDFIDRLVLEGGCGKGRHTSLIANFARQVVALDLGESAWVAFANTRHLPNVHVVMGDVNRAPATRAFDVAFSVGVLHHLPDPRHGFSSLTSHVKEGGRVVAWVYGQEGNEWITRWVDPVRKTITSRLPPMLLHRLSWGPSAALVAVIRAFYRPDSQGRGPALPYGDYFASMYAFPVDEIHSIVFDQLVTPVAHYLTEAAVKHWFDSGFRDVVVRSHRGYSWTATALVARGSA
ncbi:MAG: class I SAM-dependent methyltransferase [Archangium sp.]|nr:class I SAM-dependent methyltransferase [Archangium sp.]